jgi:hypothetical protein
VSIEASTMVLCVSCASASGAKNLDFENDIREFAAAVADLQEKRHSADYDPLFKTTISDTILTIAAARTAISQFEDAPAEGRAYFLSLLLFPPRRAE